MMGSSLVNQGRRTATSLTTRQRQPYSHQGIISKCTYPTRTAAILTAHSNSHGNLDATKQHLQNKMALLAATTATAASFLTLYNFDKEDSVSTSNYCQTEASSASSTNSNHPSPTAATVSSENHFEDNATTNSNLDDLPEYTNEDVAKNDGKNGRPIWMSYGGIVYDVTEFVQNHPGGSERILLAAGSAVEPYWYLYRQHFASDLPMRLMETLMIGTLSESSQQVIDDRMERIMEEDPDPYAHEPRRHKSLLVHTDQPMNAEVPKELLTENYLTPVELFYIRHHHPVPLVSKQELEDYEVEIDLSSLLASASGGGNDNDNKKTIRKLSLADIKKLPKVEVTTTLQCSGNRRGDMNKVQRTSGTSWSQGAISTAKWGGARLTDVLKLVGIDDPCAVVLENENSDTTTTTRNNDIDEKHVRFESLDGMKASIVMEKAVNPFGDVILAYEMNGEDIPRDHGYPLRVIVPGYAAVRNVKWVKKIEIADSEAEGAWQRGLNYKTLPPNVTDAKSVDLKKMPSMTEAGVFSGITNIDVVGDQKMEKMKPGEKVMVKAKGWAWSGGGRNIVRVDITGNNGKDWLAATITEGDNQKFGRAWAWVFWECDNVPAVMKEDGSIELASKAVDLAFNSQPEDASHGWNVRGLGNNSWFRSRAKVVQSDSD